MSRERVRSEEEEEIGKRIKREIDVRSGGAWYHNNHPINMGRRHMLGPGPGPAPPASSGAGVGGSLNTITPCAACKLLRRRCAEECPFSPYFSPHEPQKFAAVHKVFGASNVSKMLMEVGESQRADAANSLVYEANVRLRDPVYGCMGAISTLQQQLQTLQAELNAVRAEILKFKYREAAAANTLVINSPTTTPSSTTSTVVPAANLPPSQQQPPPPAPATPPPSTSVSSLYTPPPPPPPHHSTTTPGFTPDHCVSFFD